VTLNHYTPLDLQRHAYELAAGFDVLLIENPNLKPEEAFGVPPERAVVCAPIVDETTYAVALHEIGHVASPTGFVRDPKAPTLSALHLEEDSAWEWAQHYALDWTPAMEAVKSWARATYDPKPVRPLATGNKTINWSHWK